MASRLIACGLALTAFILDRRGARARSRLRRGGRVRIRRVVAVPVPPRGDLYAGGGRRADRCAAAPQPDRLDPRRRCAALAAVLAAEPYAWVALEAHPDSLPGGAWAALVASLWPVFFAWPLAITFVFPDGRLPSRRWRPYALFAAVGSMALLVLVLVMSEKLESPFEAVANPFPARWPDVLGFLRGPAWLAVFASLFVGAAAVRTRYRRSTGIERLQMLWLAYAALLVPLGVVCFLVWGLVLGEPGDAVLAVVLATQAAVALAVGVAVTRYRLYEIDRLINRTLVYAAVPASLGLLYAVISLLAGVAVGRGSTWVAALAAVLVACAFGPLRRRAQAAVDWRFDRPRCRRVAACERVRRRRPRGAARAGGGRRRARRRAAGSERPAALPSPGERGRCRRRFERRRRPSRRRTRRDEGRAPRPGDRRPPARALAARPPRPAPQRSCRREPRDRDRAPASRGARSARGGRGVAIARRPGRVRGAPAARARPARRGTATAGNARHRPAAAAALAPARGSEPRAGTRLGGRRGRESDRGPEDDRRGRPAAAARRGPRRCSRRPGAWRTRSRRAGGDPRAARSAGRGGCLLRRVRGGHERRRARGGVARVDRGHRRRRNPADGGRRRRRRWGGLPRRHRVDRARRPRRGPRRDAPDRQPAGGGHAVEAVPCGS